MSVFEVSNEHIDVIVWAAIRKSSDPGKFQNLTANEIGQAIATANRAALINRYDLPNPPERNYTYTPPKFESWNLGEILRAIECLDYQICELPDYETSEIRRLLEEIKNRAIDREAPGVWEITAETKPIREQN